MSLATALTNARPGRKTNDPQRSATRTEVPKIAKLILSALAHVNVDVMAGQHTVTMKDVWTEMAKTEELEQLEPDDRVMEATAGANIIKFLADPRKGRGVSICQASCPRVSIRSSLQVQLVSLRVSYELREARPPVPFRIMGHGPHRC
jgi:hypothetical protein